MRKLPFFGAAVSLLFVTMCVFSFSAFQTLSEDQRLFMMELNQSLLQNSTSQLQTAMKSRLGELENFIPRVFNASPNPARKAEDFFHGLRPQLKEELAAVTFFKRTETGVTMFRQYRNQRLFKRKSLGADTLSTVYQARPIPFRDFYQTKRFMVMNRSIRTAGKKGDVELNLITMLMDGAFIQGAPPDMMVVVDFAPEFIRELFKQSEIAELFLVFSDGRIFCHLDPKTMREYSERPMNHPMVSRLKIGPPIKETLEVKIGNDAYYVSAGETGFESVYAVTQTKKGGVFLVVNTLKDKKTALAAAASGLLLLLVLLIGFLGKRRAVPAEQPAPAPMPLAPRQGAGVAPKKARGASSEPNPEKSERFKDHLKTEHARVQLYYPGADSPSALAGARQSETRFEFYIGEVRPAELPKPLIKDALDIAQGALAEAASKNLGPGDTLTLCNAAIHRSFRGRLFLTLAFGHLDMVTGKLEMATAGHPPPLRFKPVSATGGSSDKGEKRRIEVMLARGERLGTKSEVGYPSVLYQLEPGDRLLAFTQGSVEAKDRQAKPWGTEGIAGAFLAGVEKGGGIARVAGGLEAHVSGGLPRGDWAILWIEWNQRAEAKIAAQATETAIEEVDPATRQETLYSRTTKADKETDSDFNKAA